LGALLFNEWPDGWTGFGTILVVLSGLYSFYREHQQRSAN
jgi:drug/metabolite transporter (DMT)-like permease